MIAFKALLLCATGALALNMHHDDFVSTSEVGKNQDWSFTVEQPYKTFNSAWNKMKSDKEFLANVKPEDMKVMKSVMGKASDMLKHLKDTPTTMKLTLNQDGAGIGFSTADGKFKPLPNIQDLGKTLHGFKTSHTKLPGLTVKNSFSKPLASRQLQADMKALDLEMTDMDAANTLSLERERGPGHVALHAFIALPIFGLMDIVGLLIVVVAISYVVNGGVFYHFIWMLLLGLLTMSIASAASVKMAGGNIRSASKAKAKDPDASPSPSPEESSEDA